MQAVHIVHMIENFHMTSVMRVVAFYGNPNKISSNVECEETHNPKTF